MTQNVILVPGATVVSYNNSYEPEPRYRARLLSALALYEQEKDSLIVISGGVFNYSEARGGKDYLIRMGIPDNKIMIIEKAKDTFENARDFKESLKNIKAKIFLITNSFHLPRAVLACLCFRLYPRVYSTDDILKERYKNIEGSEDIIIDACKNRGSFERVGFLLYLIDFFASFFGFLKFYPFHYFYKKTKKNKTIENPKWEEYRIGRYSQEINALDQLEKWARGDLNARPTG